MAMEYAVGDTPGPGVYCCQDCRWDIQVYTEQECLPKCGRCENEANTRYETVEQHPSADPGRCQEY